MIVCRLKGGLGNQMFQYATARALSIQWDVPLAIDTTRFQYDRIYRRTYELANFNISAPIAQSDELNLLNKRTRVQRPVLRKLEAIWRNRLRRNYFPYVRKWPFRKYVCLDGWWQSELYFRDVRPTLLKEFSSKIRLEEADRKLAAVITDTESVAVHFRRNNFPVLCPLDYYRRAIEVIRNQVSSPHFFLFTDDQQLPDVGLEGRYPTTMVHSVDDKPALAEFELMRLCGHHIIANSTFSWWGAWLCRREGQVVVAPRLGWNSIPRPALRHVLPAAWIGLD